MIKCEIVTRCRMSILVGCTRSEAAGGGEDASDILGIEFFDLLDKDAHIGAQLVVVQVILDNYGCVAYVRQNKSIIKTMASRLEFEN